MDSWAPAVGLTLLPNLGGLACGYFTMKSIKTWYETLKKPDWSPPNWAIAPIWTSVYTGMGYASYLVYKEGGGFNGSAKLPLIAYGTQLAINWAWPPIFFGYKNLKWGFYAVLALDISVVTCGIMFAEVNKTAGLLFIPYVMWLSVATALSYCIQRDNSECDKIKEL